MPTIDAHVHLWDLQTSPQPWIDPETMAAIDRNFSPHDLAAMLDETLTDAAVVVQASNSEAETQQLLALSHVRIAGVVGWADLTAPLEPQVEVLLASAGKLVGLRHLVHLEPERDWLLRREVGLAFETLADANLPFDLVLRPWQLLLAAEIAGRHPRTRFVLDHLGGFAESVDDLAWEADLAVIAQRPNVFAKLSGLGGGVVNHARVKRAAAIALSAFGSERLMFGSDWPMAELGMGARAWHDTTERMLSDRVDEDRERVFSGTAVAFYGLQS